MRGWALLLAVPWVLAGCIGGPADPTAPATVAVQNDSPLKLEKLPSAPSPSATTLAAAPEWRNGEWWDVRVSELFTGATFTAKRVVAGFEGPNYLVGMPADAWQNPLMVLHVPGFGEIQRSDLSFEVHDARFAPLKFPLADGDRWDTAFEGRPISAVVKVLSATEAQVELVGADGADHMVATYDTGIGEISRLVIDGYGTLEVTGHGYDYQGVVTVPHMHDLIFQQALFAGALGGGTRPGNPSESVRVDAAYDRVSFAILAGSYVSGLTGVSAAPNPQVYYDEKVTAPDGKLFEMQILPTDSPGIHAAYYMHEKPGGDWKFDHVAAGPGLVLTEGIAYHVYDVELPSGHVRASTGTHQHGS